VHPEGRARGRSILGREGSAVGDSTGPRLLSEYTRAECDNSQAIHENHLESQAVLVNRLDSERRADAARESERCTGIARDCSLGNVGGELKSHSARTKSTVHQHTKNTENPE